jgi:hypothetical protein
MRNWAAEFIGDVADRELVLEFLAVFSRFEYALKRSGYLKDGERAQPNWGKYSDDLKGQFASLTDQACQEAIRALLDVPPKTQVVTGGDLGWRETVPVEGEATEKYVLRLVRTIRNNLFHGGKFPHPVGPIADVARDRELLRRGIAVLNGCLEISGTVRGVFEEAA